MKDVCMRPIPPFPSWGPPEERLYTNRQTATTLNNDQQSAEETGIDAASVEFLGSYFNDSLPKPFLKIRTNRF